MDEHGFDLYTDEEELEYLSSETQEETVNLNVPSNAETDVEIERRLIQGKIDSFFEEQKKIKKHLEKVNAKLSVDDIVDLEISKEIKSLTSLLNDLENTRKKLFIDIDGFRLSYGSTEFSELTSKIIKETNELKTRLKKLKRLQVERYNARVDFVNNKIEALKELTDLEPEVLEMINNLTVLPRCDALIRDWKRITYVDSLDYTKLVDVNNLLNEINDKLNIKRLDLDTERLVECIRYIDSLVNKVENDIKENLTLEDGNIIRQDIQTVFELISNFRILLENNKDKITQDKYKEYLNKVNKYFDKVRKLSDTLDKNVSYDNDKVELQTRLDNILESLDSLEFNINSQHGMVNGIVINSNKIDLSIFINNLAELRKEIEKRYNDGKLDDNQYKSLILQFKKLEEKLSKLKVQLKDPGMEIGVDIFERFGKDINLLEKKMYELDEQLKSLERPIKDKNIRKNIDSIIKYIEKEIEDLEFLLERYKDDDKDKYQSLVDKLNKCKEKLTEISNKYREKCPLRVKSVKDAKDFYKNKKYKKIMLIAAGLAAMALLGFHVLIPAIIHGNIMIGATIPALSSFTTFINNILGSVIGANKVNGLWFLTNGTLLNPSVASTSLLKGLAISSISSKALIAPVILAIKELFEKMNMSELKQKLSSGYEKNKVKVNTSIDNTKRKIKQQRDNALNKKMLIDARDSLQKIIDDFRKSKSKSVDEYCEGKELTDVEINALRAYERILEEERKKIMEAQNTSRKGGK